MRRNLISVVVGTLLILAAGSGCQPKPAPSPTSPVIIPPPPQANVTRAYDVRDLVIVVPDFNDAPNFSPEPFSKSESDVGSLFGDTSAGQQQTVPSQKEAATALTRCIETAVTPGAWKIGATIHESQGRLSVTAPPDTHRDLTAFLDDVRARRSAQVMVEIRVLDLADLSLDLLDPALAKKLRIARLPIAPQDGLELTEKEVSQLIRGAEGTSRSCIITTPRITLFSGQHAYTLVAQQKLYVGGYTLKADKHGFDPQMKIAESGIILSASAAVSEDHKQVAMDLDVKISEFLGMGKTPFTGAPSEEKLMIDVPSMRVRDLRAIASVPDRTTVMFSGFHDIAEQLGWAAPATQPSVSATTPETTDKRAPVLGDNLILLVKPIVIIEKK